MKYLKCAKCKKIDKPQKAVIENGIVIVPYNCGTAIDMRCPDCNEFGKPYAILCRDCCPTGHGTRR